jgi:hypothetical protein
MNTVRPWRTINVIPLAGTWCNRFRRNDGRMLLDPCPGLLIEERGGESRVAFATYHRGLVFAACDMPGYEESSCAGGPRATPYRADLPPWLMLDEIDPAQKVADDIAARVPLATTWIEKWRGQETPQSELTG